jgi:hypothetical protein
MILLSTIFLAVMHMFFRGGMPIFFLAAMNIFFCDNPPRKIPYYYQRPIHFGHWAIVKYHPVVSCWVNARSITWKSYRGSIHALKLTRRRVQSTTWVETF